MNDWNSWLNSNETRLAVKILRQEEEDTVEDITSGSHLQEKSVEKISIDFAYSSGFLDGIRKAIMMIKEIKDYVEDKDGD